jgi:hypothetical protein
MSWDHVHEDLPVARRKPLSGFRMVAADRGVTRDNYLGVLVGDELKGKIRKHAKKNRRSMSDEVIFILSWFYEEFSRGTG